MNPRGQFVAELLDASGSSLAAGAVTRIAERSAEHRRLVDSWGFRALALDLEARLQQLSEALAVGRPELFEADMRWVSSTLVARDVPAELLECQLSALAEELEVGLPADARGPALEALLAARVNARDTAPPMSLLPVREPEAAFARRLLLAAVEGQRHESERVVLEAEEAGMGQVDVHERIVASVLAELGRLWQAGEVSVALEHLAAGTIADVLAGLRRRFPRPAHDARRVLVASVPGNQHDLGARMVADHFEMSGWRVYFLGANLPTPDLVEALAEFEPDIVGLSAGLGLHLRATAAAIESVRRAGWKRPVLVGGRVFQLAPDLWRDVGADAEARDAASAVKEALRLVAG